MCKKITVGAFQNMEKGADRMKKEREKRCDVLVTEFMWVWVF